MKPDDLPGMRELASRVGQDDVFEWMEKRAQCLAELGRSADGTVRVGQELQRACRVRSVTRGEISARAELRFQGDSFSIVFNRQFSAEIQRFSIAHEIGHTLWMDLAPEGTERESSGTMEVLCDYFAAALLMPRGDVEDVLRRYASGGEQGERTVEEQRCPVEIVPHLAKRFRVQRRIAAWRLLVVQRLASWAIVRVDNGLARDRWPLLASQEGKGEAWRTVWCETGSVGRKRSVVEGYRVPFDSRRRRIPGEMIPMELTAEARLRKLDGRWWEGVEPEPAGSARVPFGRRAGKGEALGLAARIGDSVYVGIDRECAAGAAAECTA